MKASRREVLQKGLGLAATVEIWRSRKKAGYAHEEVERRLLSGKGLSGLTKHELTTPCLLLDLDLLEANIEKMSRHAKVSGVNLRPHGKTHKCPEIALRQIKAGALGLSVATIREAESMAAAGVKGLLITSELIGRSKIERLVKLTRKQSDTMSVVDNLAHARQLSEAAAAAKVNLNVMLDVDPGSRRTGVPGGDEAIALAEKIVRLPNLKLRGIHAYSGASAHVQGYEARREHSTRAMGPALETLARLRRAGFTLEIFSGGSTGTYNIDTALEGMTELQVGSYVFMDVEYRMIGGKSGPVYDDFASSLTVLATVISKNHPDRATVDAGIKAFATDRKFGPDLKDMTGVTYSFGGDEHGILNLQNPSREVKVGDRLEFIVPHCDPSVNLYDRIYCLRGEKVEAVWRVVGRHGD
jgi:D-serine deaminase-like pyridoxal phosphate-dependent protein